MNIFSVFLIMFLSFGQVLAADDAPVMEFKSKIGFLNGEETIRTYQFFDDERKILIVGSKTLQIWDTDSGKLLVSAAHQISSSFVSRTFSADRQSSDPTRPIEYQSLIFDVGGRWLITVEKVSTGKKRSAIVRDLRSLKQIAVLSLPSAPVDLIAFDKEKNEILARGDLGKTEEFAVWNAADFQSKSQVSIGEYKWHRLINDDRKMLVGSGNTKILWKGMNVKQGDYLTLRDVKTGAVEKEYMASNLKPKTAFQETTVSEDEKYLISKRDDRVFVWEIAGNGAPQYEISNPNPKGIFNFKKIIEKRFIVVRIDDQLRVYDIENGSQPKIVVSNPNPQADVDFKDLFNNRYLIAKVDEQFRLYDIKGDGTPFFVIAPSAAKEAIHFENIINNRWIIVRANEKLRVYEAQTNALKLEVVSATAGDTMYYQAVSDDGRYIAVSDDRSVLAFDLENPEKPLCVVERDSEKERFGSIHFLEERGWFWVARVNDSENKEPRTEFYDLTTGKLLFEVSNIVTPDAKFTPDGKLLYTNHIGSFNAWNIPERTSYSLKLNFYSPPSYVNYNDPNYSSYSRETEYGTEFAELSPDYQYVLRYDGDVTSIFDAATGKLRQTIFDAKRVKYDKKTNEIKSSGLDDAGWIKNGTYIYAKDSGGLLGSGDTISFWEMKK